MSGALSLLFRAYPEIERKMVAFAKNRTVAGSVKVPAITRHILHNFFLALCREHVKDRVNEYPFNTVRKGYKAIWKWYLTKRYESPVRAANNEGGETAAQDTASSHFAASRTLGRPLLWAFTRVEMDEHHFDGEFSTNVPTSTRALVPVKARRLWVLMAVEVRALPILACTVATGLRYNRADVGRLFRNTLAAPPRRVLRLNDPEFRYCEGAAFPSELPDFAHNGFQELAYDSDASHVSKDIVSGVGEVVGCRIVNEQVGHVVSRRHIERALNVLSRAARYLPSATGNRPDDAARRDPEGEALRLNIDVTLAEEVVDVLARNFNATPNEACGGMTPLQYLQELALAGEFYRNPIDALGPSKLWRLLPCYAARLNRVRYKGRLGPLYIELFGARYTSPELARNQELAHLDRPDVFLYVQEDARYAVAVLADGTVIGNVAVVGKYSQVPHTLEWRRATVLFARHQKANFIATQPNPMIGLMKGLANVAATDDKAAALLGGVLTFMQRYGAGEVTPIGATKEELEQLQEAVEELPLGDDDELPDNIDDLAAAAAKATKPPRGMVF